MADPILDKWKGVFETPFRDNNRVTSLIDGTDTLMAMNEAIATTFTGDTGGYYIYLSAWWLDETLKLNPGDDNTQFMALIKKASSLKVQVRILLYDNLLKWIYEKAYGTGVGPAAQIKALNALPYVGAIEDGYIAAKWLSHHQKILLVKGSRGLIGFCGGIDIAFDRVKPMKRHTGSPYHDVHCRIEGPANRDLLDVFTQRWLNHPKSPPIDKQEKLRCSSDGRPGPADEKGPGTASVSILRTYLDPKGPCSKELSVRSTLLKAIPTAKRFIYVEDQYMISTECATALGKALSHLQFVYFLIPSSAISDLPRIWGARQEFIDAVFKAAPKEYANRFHVFYKLGSPGYGLPKRALPFQPVKDADWPTADDLGQHTYVHAKTWIFDDELAVIGSPNVNRRGFNFDSEAAAAIIDSKPAPQKGPYGFAQRLRMELWAEHLGLSEDDVREPLSAARLWVKQGYSDFDPDRNLTPYVRHYMDKPNADRETTAGALFAGTPSDPDQESAWDQILDPVSTPLKACPRK